MQDKEKEILDIIDPAEEPEKPPAEEPEKPPTEKEETKEEPTQKELDWRNSLDDDVKTAASLNKFKTVKELAASYLNLEKALSSQGKKGFIDPTAVRSSYEEATKASEKLFGIDEETKYDVKEEAVNDILRKHKVPPQLYNAANKDIQDFQEQKNKAEKENKLKEYKEGCGDLMDRSKLAVRLKAGFKALDITQKEWFEYLGVEAANPKIIEKIAALGKNSVSEESLKIKEGGTGNLPSNSEVLAKMIGDLKIRTLKAKKGSRDEFELRRELDKVKAKYNQVSKNTEKTKLF